MQGKGPTWYTIILVKLLILLLPHFLPKLRVPMSSWENMVERGHYLFNQLLMAYIARRSHKAGLAQRKARSKHVTQ